MQIPTIGEDQASWDEFFIGLCIYWSQKSKDRSTKVGAVIVGEGQNVLATGFNGFPRGVPDDKEQYHTRPTKYLDYSRGGVQGGLIPPTSSTFWSRPL